MKGSEGFPSLYGQGPVLSRFSGLGWHEAGRDEVHQCVIPPFASNSGNLLVAGVQRQTTGTNGSHAGLAKTPTGSCRTLEQNGIRRRYFSKRAIATTFSLPRLVPPAWLPKNETRSGLEEVVALALQVALGLLSPEHFDPKMIN